MNYVLANDFLIRKNCLHVLILGLPKDLKKIENLEETFSKLKNASIDLAEIMDYIKYKVENEDFSEIQTIPNFENRFYHCIQLQKKCSEILIKITALILVKRG